MSQYKGVTVTAVDAEMARQVYDVRLLLEPEALRRAIAKGSALEEAQEALVVPTRPSTPPNAPWPTATSTARSICPAETPLLARMLDEVRDQAALVSATVWSAMPSWERGGQRAPGDPAARARPDADGAARALHDTSRPSSSGPFPPRSRKRPATP